MASRSTLLTATTGCQRTCMQASCRKQLHPSFTGITRSAAAVHGRRAARPARSAVLHCKQQLRMPASCEPEPVKRDQQHKQQLRQVLCCGRDPSNADFEAVRAASGWSYCPGCGVAVELVGGCDHVVCRCGRGFNFSEHTTPLPAAEAAKAQAHPMPPATFEVFIKGITGKTSTIPGMKRGDKVFRLMQEVHLKQGVAPDEQRLLYGGKQLQSHLTLDDYGISPLATVHLVVRLRGGA